jgi:hypothetical protein
MHLPHGSDHATYGIGAASSSKDSAGGADVRISVRVKNANPAQPAQHTETARSAPGSTSGAAAPKRISGTLRARPVATARRRQPGTSGAQ